MALLYSSASHPQPSSQIVKVSEKERTAKYLVGFSFAQGTSGEKMKEASGKRFSLGKIVLQTNNNGINGI